MAIKNYKVPFSNGDEVYSIWNGQEHYWEDCTWCDATGKVKIKDNVITCPECYGRKGSHKSKLKAWNVTNSILTIGEVRIEHRKGEKFKFIAMCHQTGIGSGTLHDMCNFFLTKEEAQKECEKRNSK